MLELHSKERKEENKTNKTIREDQRTKYKVVEDGCLISNVLPPLPLQPLASRDYIEEGWQMYRVEIHGRKLKKQMKLNAQN